MTTTFKLAGTDEHGQPYDLLRERQRAQRKEAWTVREMRWALAQLGCKLERFSGSHEIWKTPSGVSLPPMKGNHASERVSRKVLRDIRNALEAAGLNLDWV